MFPCFDVDETYVCFSFTRKHLSVKYRGMIFFGSKMTFLSLQEIRDSYRNRDIIWQELV